MVWSLNGKKRDFNAKGFWDRRFCVERRTRDYMYLVDTATDK
ncbi:MAG TPA: hypothetical protein VF905_00210 [Nitrospirota bacterium]